MLIQSAQRLSLLLLLKLEEVVVLSHNVPVAAGVVQTASTAAAAAALNKHRTAGMLSPSKAHPALGRLYLKAVPPPPGIEPLWTALTERNRRGSSRVQPSSCTYSAQYIT